MNKKQCDLLFKTLNIVNKLEKFTINTQDIDNEGFSNYIRLVYSIVSKCIKEPGTIIVVTDYIYKIYCLYNNWKIYIILNENNLDKLYLIINNRNIDISIDLSLIDIKIYLEYGIDTYLIIQLKKNEKLNYCMYCEKNRKIEKKTYSSDLLDIIKKLETNFSKKNNTFLKEIKDIIYDLQNDFNLNL